MRVLEAAASVMLNKDMSIVEISKYLRHYMHLMPGGLEKAMDVFDRVIPVKY
jgi:hypothetical protein